MLLPLLKWAGGKRRLTQLIRPIWENEGTPRLVEPFCGGMAIALGLQPKSAVLNDINPHLINFYRWVKQGFEFKIPTDQSDGFYYEERKRFNDLIRKNQWDTLEAAQLFYYLNKTCFNGLCRFNKQGYFNVPVGHFNYEVKYLASFADYAQQFKNWEFSIGKFSDVRLNPDDFVFADPPYDVDFRGYSKDGFVWNDQEALVDWLRNHNGPIVICNHATPRIINMYTQYNYDLKFISEKICITANGNRQRANIILATKNLDGSAFLQFIPKNHSYKVEYSTAPFIS